MRQWKTVKPLVHQVMPVAMMLGFLLLLASPTWAQGAKEGYNPQSLYDDVWKLINARYVDVTKNGQDWNIWRNRFDSLIQDEEDVYVAVETMLASLGDRYTRFLDPEEFAEEGRSIKATLFGIGIQIGVRDEKLLIVAPIEDTPAFKAGLKPNDEILEIDGASAKGMSVKDAAEKIRGEKGTYVKLFIRREGKKDRMYEVMRDKIKLKAVSLKNPFNVTVPRNMGYIKLSSFLSNNAAVEVRNALKELTGKEGYILDLRSNPGGLLSNAITIADFFLEEGGIVSTVDRDGYKEVREARESVETDKPLVVLIDEGSASASEILSGALRDNNRALLVGKKSFGKGLVQEINQLPGGAGINITTQRYLTPNDTDINLTGIIPDITVEATEDDYKDKRDPQLEKAVQVLGDMLQGKSIKLLQSRSLTQNAIDAQTLEDKKKQKPSQPPVK
ncbi:MAG: S41 family peptidase [Candidatus Melainabacteria bacterium]|nr:S41 family peptidase [Candidatus Melainabacteria bacterium]